MTLDSDDVAIARSWLDDRTGWNHDDEIRKFESAFAKWNGSNWAYSFLGGRVALSAAIYALDLKPGDEVIVPGYTCVVVPNAFQYAGIVPVYCDIELETWGSELSSIEARVSTKTRAILIQHLYGLVCRDYEAILNFAQRHNLFVIEDCAHSTGAKFKEVKVGNRAAIGFYSCEQSKIFNTTQGGIAVTQDEGLSRRLAEFQLQAPMPAEERTERLLYTLILNYFENKKKGKWWRGELMNLRIGRRRLESTTAEEENGIRPAHYGCRMPAPIAAVGRNQLKKLDALNQMRRKGAERWEQWCRSKELIPPTVIPESEPVFLRYPVMVEECMKSDRGWAARDLNVNLGIWFASQKHPVAGTIDGCPNALEAVRRCINFPTLFA